MRRPTLRAVSRVGLIVLAVLVGHWLQVRDGRVESAAYARRIDRPGDSRVPRLIVEGQLANSSGGPPDRFIRHPDEWRGMLIDPAKLQSYCESATDCGMAMACVSGGCVPCGTNHDCGPGEACVLQHCVLTQNVGCHTRSDCGPDLLCTLTGYSEGPRNNRDMLARCAGGRGGASGPESIVQPQKGYGPGTTSGPKVVDTASVLFERLTAP
jgi:hypothetical protein